MRGRSKNPNENPGVKPVERIELSEKSPKKRIIAAAILLAIGLGFLGYALFTGLDRAAGWTQIEPVSASSESVAIDLVMFYDLGASGRSTNAEYRDVSALYTELCATAYRLFHAHYGFDGVHNPYYINRHPGEVIAVDSVLYEALETVKESGNRVLFAGPFYTEYMNLFADTEDASAALVDPYKNDEIAAYFAQLSVFTGDPEHIDLELLGDGKVKLSVSQEYLNFAKENGIENFIDFYWTRNAFVVDYIAQAMTEQGYEYGSISSYDGFMRVFDGRQTSYSYHLYGRVGGSVYDAARLVYDGKNSLVCLRAFRINDRDEIYYAYANGEERHPYLDVTDGLCKNATDSLVSYSRERSCGEVLMEMLGVYVTETFDTDAVLALTDSKIYSVYFDGDKVVYNDDDVIICDLFTDETVAFVKTRAQNS